MQRQVPGRMRTALMCLLVSFAAVPGGHAGDFDGRLNAGAIKESYAEMERLLNGRAEFDLIATYLHNAIAEDARFEMSVSRPARLGPQAGNMKLELDKVQYINSFLMGTGPVENYRIEIRTVNIEIDDKAQTARVGLVMRESGTFRNPYDPAAPARDFESLTLCQMVQVAEAGRLRVKSGVCKTRTEIPQEI